jgi:AcrR family transcriptional regulator
VVSRPTQEQAETLQERRSRETQVMVIKATVKCLDEFGYAETTISKVQDSAGVSRGALTHHFPNKQSLIVATSVWLLENATRPLTELQSGGGPMPDIEDLVFEMWSRVADNQGGRAFLEILLACRSDKELQEMLSPMLQAWDRDVGLAFRDVLRAHGRKADQAEMLWALVRTFCRGLILHQNFVDSTDYTREMLARFARMLDPELET